MEFSRQECWNGLPFPSSGNLPDPGIEPRSPAFQADSLLSELPGKPICTRSHLNLPPVQAATYHNQSLLCCTLGPCWLSVLNRAVCTCASGRAPQRSLSPPSPQQQEGGWRSLGVCFFRSSLSLPRFSTDLNAATVRTGGTVSEEAGLLASFGTEGSRCSMALIRCCACPRSFQGFGLITAPRDGTYCLYPTLNLPLYPCRR